MRANGLLADAKRWLWIFETLVLPPTCGGCGRRGAWFCTACAEHVRREAAARCSRCDAPLAVPASRCQGCSAWPPELLLVRAPYVFHGPVRVALHRAKYRGEHARARELGRRLAVFAASEFAPVLGGADLVVPIPLHPSRRRERGFNQSELLAAPVADALGLALVHDLERERSTRPQVGLGREARSRNLSGAFRWSGRHLNGAIVLVVDDVVTTGATLGEAARTLAAAGAAGVIGLALAREPLQKTMA